jgi:hypothetical protein
MNPNHRHTRYRFQYMEQYFVIHVARQSEKTTYLNDLAERL